MKVKVFKNEEETNEFLARDDIKAETITPMNDGRFCIVYKEKLVINRTVYEFGCGSHLGTMWSRNPVCLSDSEYKDEKEKFIRTELNGEANRFRERVLDHVEDAYFE